MAFGIDLDLSTPGANYKIKRCIATMDGSGAAVLTHGFTKVLAVLPFMTAAANAVAATFGDEAGTFVDKHLVGQITDTVEPLPQ